MALEKHLLDIKSVKGYQASGIMHFTGELLAFDSVAPNIDLALVGATFNDVFRTAHEVCDKIGPGWFWTSEENDSNRKTAEEVVAMLKLCTGRRANYLLNVAPDKSGLIPASTVARLREIGKLRGVRSIK